MTIRECLNICFSFLFSFFLFVFVIENCDLIACMNTDLSIHYKCLCMFVSHVYFCM